MNRIYFGRYFHADSFLHNMNTLLKFLIFISTIVLVSSANSLALLLLFTILVFILSKFSKINIKILLYYVKPFLFLLIFTFIIQLIFSQNGSFNPNFSNLGLSLIYTLRFFLIILLSALLTITTSPFDLVKIIYHLMIPLKVFKINSEEIAITSILAIRFIPLVFEEAEKIRIAQKIRGEERSFFKNLFSIDEFIIPLINRIFYFADQMSITLMYKRDWSKILKFSMPKNKEFLVFITIELLILLGFRYV